MKFGPEKRKRILLVGLFLGVLVLLSPAEEVLAQLYPTTPTTSTRDNYTTLVNGGISVQNVVSREITDPTKVENGGKQAEGLENIEGISYILRFPPPQDTGALDNRISQNKETIKRITEAINKLKSEGSKTPTNCQYGSLVQIRIFYSGSKRPQICCLQPHTNRYNQ